MVMLMLGTVAKTMSFSKKEEEPTEVLIFIQELNIIYFGFAGECFRF